MMVLIVIFAAGMTLGVFRLILQMEIDGAIDYPLLYGIVAFDAVLVVAVILNARRRELQVGDVSERLAPRTKEDSSSRAGWILKVFDNGLVLQAQARGAMVSMYLCYGEDRRPRWAFCA
jgi:hypothetical protein